MNEENYSIGYTNNEMISSTNLQKSLSKIINQLTTHKLNKVAILRNNKIETVMICREDYEKLTEELEHLKYLKTYNEIKEREKTPESEYVDFEDILKSNNEL